MRCMACRDETRPAGFLSGLAAASRRHWWRRPPCSARGDALELSLLELKIRIKIKLAPFSNLPPPRQPSACTEKNSALLPSSPTTPTGSGQSEVGQKAQAQDNLAPGRADAGWRSDCGRWQRLAGCNPALGPGRGRRVRSWGHDPAGICGRQSPRSRLARIKTWRGHRHFALGPMPLAIGSRHAPHASPRRQEGEASPTVGTGALVDRSVRAGHLDLGKGHGLPVGVEEDHGPGRARVQFT